MSDALHTFFEDRLRHMLTGKIPGQQLDSLITTLTNVFKFVRPTVKPDNIFVAASEPSVCEQEYCCCKYPDCRRKKYKISIFIDRREQGRRVTKPWVRVSSIKGFKDAARSLIVVADKMIARAESDEPQSDMDDSETCCVEVLSDIDTIDLDA